MTAHETTLCILGASGDLTSRLLLPALGQLLTDEPERRVRLVGAGIDEWDDAQWRAVVTDAFAAAGATGKTANAVREHAVYRRTDITDPEDLARRIPRPRPGNARRRRQGA